MAEIAGVVVSPVLTVAEWLAAPIWSPLKHLYNYGTNFKNLEKEVKKMESTRDEVQRKITAAENNVEEIKQEVKDWKTDVEETITKAKQLIEEKANTPRCFKGLCPNFIARYKESKKAFKLKRDVIDPLIQQETEFHVISVPTNPPEIWLRSSEDYLAFESRNSTVNNVWDALKDETVDKIGVFGMGGLGKTTLVQEVGRNAAKEKLFEEIVFVEVGKSPDTKKIQTIIAEKLGLTFKNESEMAKKLYERMKGKNILLILDNIWEDLHLTEAFGVPSGVDRGRNKLLLTTRDKRVLRKMGCTKNFGMGFLNQEEAWTLFAKMAGNVVQTRELQPLPNEVCNECRGLPIVICTIAKALTRETCLSEWKVALQELRAPSPPKLMRFLEEEYTKIALSYKYLRNDELKETFLISSLLENDTSISDLFKHVVCLDILKGANMTMEDKRNLLDKLVRDLKAACLLLDGFKSGQFAMHDVIRAVATTIAHVDHHVFTTRNDIEGDWKNRDELKKCTKISLPGDSIIISQLWPNDLDCPNLEYFSMTNMWESSFEIPKDLFKVMPKLRVLNLDRLRQSPLPSSIDLLTNLQTLCLDSCKIKDVAVIGKLRKLKVLSLQRAGIEELPMEMGRLIELRLLDLTNCWTLKVIAPNVISKLSKLEELYMKGCNVEWEIELLKELKLLSGLTSLELDIEDNKALTRDLFFKELKRYQISIGRESQEIPRIDREHEILRKLVFNFNSTIYLEELGEINNVEVLILARYLDEEDDHEHSQSSVHSNESTSFFNKKVIFPGLKVLMFRDIISRRIWDSQLPTSSFQNLKDLRLWRCKKIKYVFPSSIARSLQQLQYIEISHCKVLEGIFDVEEGTEPAVNVFFPQVTKLMLEILPEFTDFSPGIYSSEWPKLKELEVEGCGKFKMLTSEPESLCFGQKVIFPDLEVLRLWDIISRKIWDSQLPTSSFQNLKKLRLQRCTKIKYVFPSSIARSLQQLQYIEIRDCEVLEGIVDVEEGTLPAVNFLFPQVTKLELEDLPELTDFYPGMYYSEWPKLKELEVRGCHKFKVLTSKSLCLDQKINHDLDSFELMDIGDQFEGLIIRQSKCLRIYNYESVDIPLGMVLQRFENLTFLDLRYCHRFLNLITPSTARSLAQLRELKLVDCRMLIEILENEGDATTEIVFEKLNKLLLSKLESLVCFCSGSYTFNFPSLEELNITECPAMKTFCGGILTIPKLKKINYERKEEEIERNNLNEILQRLYKKQSQCKLFHDNNSTEICYNQHPISFYQNLTHLALSNCGNIKYAFPSSIAKSLHQLQQLEIINCKVLEEIVAKEDGTNAVVNFNFPNLTSLKLEDLPELTVFYPGKNNLELPKLKELVVKNCVKYVSFKENKGETELNILDPQSIFLDNKINFDLEEFILHDGEKDIHWQSQPKSLKIVRDNSTNIPLRLLQRFENVRELQLDCNRYKDIKSLCDFPNLEVLHLFCNARLMSLVPFSESFQNLKVLKVNCSNGFIMKLITPSVVRSLVQLRDLSISRCGMLTEIVENEGDATTSPEIVFNNLNKLSLGVLESLTCFCSGNYSFSFPSLEELIITFCPNLKNFCRGSLSTPKLYKVIYVDRFREREVVEIGENDLNTTIEQRHKKKVDSFSKELTLSERDIMTTLQGEFHENFGKVKALHLIKDDYDYISRNIIMKFINLETLTLTVSSYEEIFSCGEGEEHVGALAKLKNLKLQGLFNLKCIWKQDFQFKSILQNLRELEVKYCHNLMTLLPPSSSFENLTSLEVEGCNGMQNLMTSSTAKSLICLKRLSINGCEMMTEVLANEEEIEKDEIVFEKLKVLSLFELESLTCFCYGNYALKFPFLESLYVRNCFKMKTFSREDLNMPRLQNVNMKDCTNDLYSVLQQLQNDCSKLRESFPW